MGMTVGGATRKAFKAGLLWVRAAELLSQPGLGMATEAGRAGEGAAGGQDPKEPTLHLYHCLELQKLGSSEWTPMSTTQGWAYGDPEVPSGPSPHYLGPLPLGSEVHIEPDAPGTTLPLYKQGT